LLGGEQSGFINERVWYLSKKSWTKLSKIERKWV
jgi:hypothetical protein